MQDVAYPSTSTVDMQDVLATTGSSNGINGNTIVMIDDDMPSMSLLVADGASSQNVDDLLLPDFDFQYIDSLENDMSQSFQQYCPTSHGFVSFIAAEVIVAHKTFFCKQFDKTHVHTNMLHASIDLYRNTFSCQ